MSKTSSSSSSQFTCAACGQGFEQKSKLERHMETSHPPSAPSAADIQKALAGIDYPKSKDGIRNYARKNLANFTTKEKQQRQLEANVLDLLDRIPEKQYSDMADVEREAARVL